MSATDLFTSALAELSPDARRYYEVELAEQPATQAMVELLVRIAQLGGLTGSRAMCVALQAGMLHRTPALHQPLDLEASAHQRLEAMPFAIDVELERALLGHRSHEAMVRHCPGDEDRIAAALFALACAWVEHEAAPAWVWEPLASLGVAESDLAELERQLVS